MSQKERQQVDKNCTQMRNRVSLLAIEEMRMKSKFDKMHTRYEQIIKNKNDNE